MKKEAIELSKNVSLVVQKLETITTNQQNLQNYVGNIISSSTQREDLGRASKEKSSLSVEQGTPRAETTAEKVTQE